MIIIRPSHERGHANYGWLDTYHSFSFADYYDRKHMGFGSLRVINQDRVSPGAGFPTHGHQDMEIITYVLEGILQHHDSMGNGSLIHPGEVQRMSAGTGITHSEYNASTNELVHLLQIWILPEKTGLTPSYEQKAFPNKQDKLCLVGSPDGRQDSVTIHQNVFLYAAELQSGNSIQYSLEPGRKAYLQVAKGVVQLNEYPLKAGDGARIEKETSLTIKAEENAEVLLFDLVV